MTSELEARIPPANDFADANQADLYRRLLEVQRLEHWRRWGRHLALLFLSLVIAVMILATLDYYLVLPSAVRAIGLLLAVALCGALVFRARRDCAYASAQAAADVEAAFPRYGQRLRTAFDYADHPAETAPASPGLLKALNEETRQISRVDDFRQASSPRNLYLGIAGCLVLLAICGGSLMINPELRLTAGRLMLLPIDYTTLLLKSIDSPVAQGEDAEVQVILSGRAVDHGEIRFRRADSQDDWQAVPLSPEGLDPEDGPSALSGPLTATVADCQEDLEVEILAGPRPYPIQRIRVLQPLEVLGFSATIQPPAYTGRESETADSESFSVWEGSQVDLQFELNQVPGRIQLIPESSVADNDTEDESPGQAPVDVSVDGNTASVRLVEVRHPLRFTLDAESPEGMVLDSPRYHIRVQLDERPQIRFVTPDEQLEVVATTEVPLAIEAGDDLGVTKVGVFYKMNDGEEQTLWEQECESPPDSLHAEETLFLENHQLTYHDAVTYYAFAEDRYFDGSRRVSTPLRFIDIRPFKRSYEVAEASGGT